LLLLPLVDKLLLARGQHADLIASGAKENCLVNSIFHLTTTKTPKGGSMFNTK